jgi:hypothetical protein
MTAVPGCRLCHFLVVEEGELGEHIQHDLELLLASAVGDDIKRTLLAGVQLELIITTSSLVCRCPCWRARRRRPRTGGKRASQAAVDVVPLDRVLLISGACCRKQRRL